MKKALILFDLSSQPPENQDYSELLRTVDWKVEAEISDILKKNGFRVQFWGIYDDIQGLIDHLKAHPPDLVFNLSEACYDDRRFEPKIVALLELLRVRYTGAGSAALEICKDKALTKKVLSYHGIQVPAFRVSPRVDPLMQLKGLSFPVITKPMGLEASEGISQGSVSYSEEEALQRIQFIHERFNVDAIVEEYIDGRELYVGVLGNKRLSVLPPREIHFGRLTDSAARIATYHAKWNEGYRQRWGIRNGPAQGLTPELRRSIESTAKKIYRILGLNGYARFDLRLTDEGQIYFLEANPNPSIARDDDFASAAKQAGISYSNLIEKIVRLARQDLGAEN